LQLLTIVLTLACWATGGLTQEPQSRERSPKEVVAEFCKFETAGGRLTPEGWNKAAGYFVRATPPSREKTILVTAKDFSVWDPVFRSEIKADVIVGVVGRIWKIDSRMNFSPYSPPGEVKTSFFYTVIRTNKHWELGPDGQVVKEVTGALEWRIEGTSDTIWLTTERATRYVTEVRDRTSDHAVKQNAEKTLARLRHLQP